ncbi:hypothetical protein [Bradyrhizobium vignae]|uniref:Uncharacterized protein n=1 Tax=Bradyrhizobium vignae TaxID=1549949 RepID=A0ABS3ZZK9_9BRAD|nr:hypothetical protein [Bradyrhizobium vignae]MBP0113190.1 hypothetical protein [Bradyrhizobium vignae]
MAHFTGALAGVVSDPDPPRPRMMMSRPRRFISAASPLIFRISDTLIDERRREGRNNAEL